MTLEEFRATLSEKTAPDDIRPELKALWIEANGRWDRAHKIVQSIDSREAAWVHAYLHRKEGDTGNAGYWYSRAGRPMSSESFDDEWNEIAGALLE